MVSTDCYERIVKKEEGSGAEREGEDFWVLNGGAISWHQ